MKTIATVTGLALAFGTAAALAGEAAEPAGKAIFVASKCQGCHAVSAQGLGLDDKATGAAEEGEEAGEDEVKAPDLSGTGLKRDAKFLDEYLRKQATIDGRKHRRRFAGTKEERAKLIEWLVTLKTEVKPAAAPAGK